MNPYPPTEPSAPNTAPYTPPYTAPYTPPYIPPGAPPSSPVATMTPQAPVPPQAPLARNMTASIGVRVALVAVALIVAVVIAAASVPGSLVAARLSAFPKPSVTIGTSVAGSVSPGQSVTFTALRNAGNQLSYSWSFGDNSSGATGPVVSHTFSDFGEMTVTLTATDPTGQSAQATTPVHVLPPPPTASFTYSTSYYYGCDVSFDGGGSSSQAGITDYSWDYGDGGADDTGSISETYHYYQGSGTYTATLTVTDTYGQTSSTQQTIQVSC
jgi:hypothetical protein